MKRLTKKENGRLKIRLAGRHRQQLERLARTHPKPQVRERAAAVLKVADGQSVGQVLASSPTCKYGLSMDSRVFYSRHSHLG